MLERAVEVVLGRVADDGPGAHRLVEHRDAAATRFLRVVHRGVGVAEQLLGAFLAGRQRDADAGAHERLRATDDERLGDGLEEPFGDLDRAVARSRGREVVAEDREFVAAEARHRVAGPQHRLQPARDRHQELVTGVVTDAVVHVLEPIEVDEQDRDLAVHPLAPRDRQAQAVEEQQPVRQPRQGIVHRLVREPFLERLALDGDRRQVREQREDLLVLGVGRLRDARVHVDRPEHCVPIAREDRRRPRGPEVVGMRQVAVVGPPRVVGDVGNRGSRCGGARRCRSRARGVRPAGRRSLPRSPTAGSGTRRSGGSGRRRRATTSAHASRGK